MKRIVRARHIPNLRKLTGFKFMRHPKYNMPNEILNKIERLIQKRGRDALDFYRQNQNATEAEQEKQR